MWLVCTVEHTMCTCYLLVIFVLSTPELVKKHLLHVVQTKVKTVAWSNPKCKEICVLLGIV